MSGRNQSNRKRNSGVNKKKANNNKKKSAKVDPKVLWGDFDALPSPDGFTTSTPDPVAVVTSLGTPPLPGHGAASPHYFKLVYGRATQLAGALAMAGGIDDLTPEPLPEPELEEELEDAANLVDEEDGDEDGNSLAEDGNSLAEDGNSLAEASADEDTVNLVDDDPLAEASADEGE